MRTTENKKEVSARVLLTVMQEDGLDQFTFMRPSGKLKPQMVEALLQFNDSLQAVHLMRALNVLLSSLIARREQPPFSSDQMFAIENLINLLVDCWEVDTGTFEPLREKIFV